MNEDAMPPEKVRGVIEAILMTADAPVTPGRFLGFLKELNGRDLRQAIDALKEQYDQAGHAFTVAEVAGGFQLATRKEYGPWIRKFHNRNQVQLTQAGLETLAIIAYKQPITRVEVDSIRGVNSGGVFNTLMEVSMIRIVGRSDGLGKPHLFGTTKEFLLHFGLKGLTDLPKPKELEELLAGGGNDMPEVGNEEGGNVSKDDEHAELLTPHSTTSQSTNEAEIEAGGDPADVEQDEASGHDEHAELSIPPSATESEVKTGEQSMDEGDDDLGVGH
jgi:segregation and condensation protein B